MQFQEWSETLFKIHFKTDTGLQPFFQEFCRIDRSRFDGNNFPYFCVIWQIWMAEIVASSESCVPLVGFAEILEMLFLSVSVVRNLCTFESLAVAESSKTKIAIFKCKRGFIFCSYCSCKIILFSMYV